MDITASSLCEVTNAAVRIKDQIAKEYAERWWKRKRKDFLKVANKGKKRVVVHVRVKYWPAIHDLLLYKGFCIIANWGGLFYNKIVFTW